MNMFVVTMIVAANNEGEAANYFEADPAIRIVEVGKPIFVTKAMQREVAEHE